MMRLENSAARRLNGIHLVWVVVLILAWLLLWTPFRPLLVPDEGRYVGVAWEMLRSGNWITPTLNGFPYFHKRLSLFPQTAFVLLDYCGRIKGIRPARMGGAAGVGNRCHRGHHRRVCVGAPTPRCVNRAAVFAVGAGAAAGIRRRPVCQFGYAGGGHDYRHLGAAGAQCAFIA